MKSVFFRYILTGFLCILSGSAMADLMNPRVEPANPRVGDEVIYFVDAPYPDDIGAFFVSQNGSEFTILVSGGFRVTGPMDTLEFAFSLGTVTVPGTYSVIVPGNGIGLPPPITFVVSPAVAQTVPTLSFRGVVALVASFCVLGVLLVRGRGSAGV